MKTNIVTHFVILLCAFSFGHCYAQVPNKNESELPAEGSIFESNWGNYLLSNNTAASRALRIGVSNDQYTRGEIEIQNNNSLSSDIIFKTTNTNGGALPRMIIKDNGNVGIGTNRPTSKLHIEADYDAIATFKTSDNNWLYTNWVDKNNVRKAWVGLDKNLTAFTINLENGANQILLNGGNVGIGKTQATSKLHIADVKNEVAIRLEQSNEGIHDPQLSGTSVIVQKRNNKSIGNYRGELVIQGQDYDNGYYMRDIASFIGNGNVGIGTISPTEKLHIQEGNVNIFGYNTSRYIRFTEDNLQGGFINYDGASNVFNIGVNNVNSTDVSNDVKSISIVRTSGNVGIGTTTPDSKLAVKGKIHAEEVKIDLSVPAPDYVFKKDYELLTIEEVQKHIKEKGHLPNIPSAAVLETEGVELGVMNMKLLEKIEELTLYTIAQEKRIKELESRDAKIKVLEERLDLLVKDKN